MHVPAQKYHMLCNGSAHHHVGKDGFQHGTHQYAVFLQREAAGVNFFTLNGKQVAPLGIASSQSVPQTAIREHLADRSTQKLAAFLLDQVYKKVVDKPDDPMCVHSQNSFKWGIGQQRKKVS